MNDKLFFNLDRIVTNLKPVNALVDRVLSAVTPKSQASAAACANYIYAGGYCWGTCWLVDSTACGPTPCTGATSKWYECEKKQYLVYTNGRKASYIGRVTMCGYPSDQWCGAQNCSNTCS